MSENSKTPFNKELIELLLLFSFIVLWVVNSHAQPVMILNNDAEHPEGITNTINMPAAEFSHAKSEHDIRDYVFY
ncbi:MAG: hypothetical protein K0S44_111 [Bacteroidetes bacterium]|jgi:hypothetical protein|nr:hypothetical protein [Bacteroidota bacterium]